MSYLDRLAIVDRTSVALRAGLSEDPSDVSMLISQAESALAQGAAPLAQAHYIAALELAVTWARHSGTTARIEHQSGDELPRVLEARLRAALEARYPDIGLAFVGEDCTDYASVARDLTDHDRVERLNEILDTLLAVPLDLQDRAERIATLSGVDLKLFGYR